MGPFVGLGPRGCPDAVGPPAAAVCQETAEVPALAAGAPVGREAHEQPARPQEEFLEVRLELLEPRQSGKEIGARRPVAVHPKQEAVGGGSALDFKQLPVPRETPNL